MPLSKSIVQWQLRLVSGIAGLWIRPSVLPEAPAVTGSPVCYVLQDGGLADRIALQRACRRHGLPLPADGLPLAAGAEPTALVRLRRYRGFIARQQSPELSPRLQRICATETTDTELAFVPVAVYWGRSPDKEGGLFKLAFSERWELVGRTRRFFATLLLGRSTLVQFSEPLRLADILADSLGPERSARKVSRIMRVHFRHRRTAVVGPDLSHRRTLVDRLLLTPGVQLAIKGRHASKGISLAEAKRDAKRYAMEIAADVSYPTVRILDRVLAWIWNRLYDGIRVLGTQRLHAVSEDNAIVYVPCHRSHMDYLLLSYVIYHQGLSLPHIAAGINLNLPVIGPLLRRGGAFFLRRSFKGNRLYAAVFDAYLQRLQSAGFSTEYFIEGGRSRSGRLLTPKTGMLSMTVNGFVKQPSRPLVFVPVYFGYEKLLEGKSFVSELEGGRKEKESLFALLRSLGKLREKFGQVYVNFGEPLTLTDFLDAEQPQWRNSLDSGERPEWLGSVSEKLGTEIMQRINASAAVTPVALIATALLGTPRQSMGFENLAAQIDFYRDLLAAEPYANAVELPERESDAMIEHAIELNAVKREPHALGDVVRMDEKSAVLMTYFRNNVAHLFALHASIACAFMNGQHVSMSQLQRLVRLSYPFVVAELTLFDDLETLEGRVKSSVDALKHHGLLIDSDEHGYLEAAVGGSSGAFKLQVLASALVPTLQRFYLCIALLVRFGQGHMTAVTLERTSEMCAQRLAMTFGLRSPDFFDRQLFQRFTRALVDQKIIWKNSEGRLHYNESLGNIQLDARRILGEQVHHSILSVAMADELLESEIQSEAAANV